MTMTTSTIRVLVVDAVPASRTAIVRALEEDGDLSVVGRCDPAGALAAVQTLRPDVVALSGLDDAPVTGTVETIMAFAPTPILVLRSPGTFTAGTERDDLEAGAVGVLAWPASGDEHALRTKIRMLRRVAVVRHPRARLRPGAPRPVGSARERAPRIVGMAASTGGPHTLVDVVKGLATITVPVLIVQHIHPEFVDGFVQWLSRASGARTVLAEHGMHPEPGVFHVAPGGFHLRVAPDRRLVLDPEPPALHQPSANELFQSMASSLGRAAVGVLLTGMGDDGASGLLEIHRAGGRTIVQDGATSAIDGMPRAARELGAADVVAPLADIPRAVFAALEVPR